MHIQEKSSDALHTLVIALAIRQGCLLRLQYPLGFAMLGVDALCGPGVTHWQLEQEQKLSVWSGAGRATHGKLKICS
jgi:hypothetical protein